MFVSSEKVGVYYAIGLRAPRTVAKFNSVLLYTDRNI